MNLIKKIKICLVLPSLEPGGMERVMSELAWEFSKKEDVQVHLVLFGSNRKIFYSIPDNIIIHKPDWNFDKNKRKFHAIKTFLFLRKKITSLQPDTILSFGEMWNNIVMISLLGTGLPVYISDRSQPNKNHGYLQNILTIWLYPRAAGLMLQTEKARAIYEKKYNNLNVQVIGNPIRHVVANEPVFERQNNVLMIGRLVQGKNQDRLIKIFARIGNPLWKLILVGDDLPGKNQMKELKELTIELGIVDQVVFTGEQYNVEQYYLTSKIFAFTSNSEGFPNVVGEAMSAGLPVISYDCLAGPSDLIKDSSNGFLIPIYDDVEFQERLKRLMDNDAICARYGRQAKEDIKQFSASLISEKFYDFITSHLKLKEVPSLNG